MDVQKLERRSSSMDIARIVAVFTVLSVHFFLHNGFYSEPVSGLGPVEGVIEYFKTQDPSMLHGPIMFVMVTMRTLFSVCVPLFLILTGYLMSRKTLSKSYYKGIRKTLIIFVLASVFCMIHKSIHGIPAANDAFWRFDFNSMFKAIEADGGYTLKKYILSIFDFKGANYSWYIEMYIGLFLLIPFLNLAYNKLDTKRKKQVLVGTLVLVTTLPTLFNIFNFDSVTWWTTPTESDEFQKLLPSFWMGFYPITYYFTGCYIREYGLKLKTKPMIITLILSLFLFTSFNFFRSYGGGFKSGIYVYWYGFEPYVLSTLLFTLISRIKSDNWKPGVKLALWKVSDLALGIYLMSFVFDELIYENLKAQVPVMVDRLPYYFITVLLCFILSAAFSALLNLMTAGIIRLYEIIRDWYLKNRDTKRFLRQDMLFGALMIFGLLLALWKMNYGFGGNDEAFYLTIPQRLTLGDAMFRDEWHLSQLSGFLTLPFVWLYTTIAGTTEGIIIAARCCYVIVHAGAAVLIYTRLRKLGYLSVAASFFFFIYTPYNIMVLNYDSMGVGLLALSGVLLATADYDKKLWLILSGLCLAGAVLCNPYLASLYFLYLLCVVVRGLLSLKFKSLSKPAIASDIFKPRTFLWFSAGVFALAAVFLIFTLTRVGFGDIFKNLPLMMEDPEHPSYTLGHKVSTYFNSIKNLHPHFKYALYTYGAMLLVMIFDKKRRLHRSLYLIVSTAVVIFTYILLVPNLDKSSYNAIMFPLIFVGVTSYLLCENKPKEFLAALFIPGIVYSFCIHCTSNQYFYVISMALSVTNLASLIFLGRLIKEMKEKPDNIEYAVWVKRFSFGFAFLMIVLQGSFQLASKIHHVFWDAEPSKLEALIEEGPAGGIYTTQANADNYMQYYNDLQDYAHFAPGNILFMSEKTWFYLAAEGYDYGTYSAWLSGENSNTLRRLSGFYEINPEKIPKYIYVPKNSKWDINEVDSFAAKYGLHRTETPVSYRYQK